MVNIAMSMREMVAHSILQLTNLIPIITARMDRNDDLEITVTERLNHYSCMMLRDETLFKVLSDEMAKNIAMQAKECIRQQWRRETDHDTI